MQEEKTIHQHVVPQTWLKRFTYNKNKTSLYMYDKNDRKEVGSKNIANIAGFEYFYDFHPEIFKHFFEKGVFVNIEDEQYVEKKFFSYHIENKLGRLLKDIVQTIDKRTSDVQIFSDEQRISLSVNIAIQFFRNNLMRQVIVRLLEAIDEYGKEKDIEELKIEPDKYKEFFHFLIMQNSKPISSFAINLSKRKWIIYETKDDKPFVISDNPVVFQKFSDKGTNVCVPLSKNYLLVLNHESVPMEFDNVIMEVDPLLSFSVNDFNNLQYHQCEKEIYSSVENFSWIDDTGSDPKGLTPVFTISDESFKEYVQAIINLNTESKK